MSKFSFGQSALDTNISCKHDASISIVRASLVMNGVLPEKSISVKLYA
jgi:hypothetical protein